MTQCCALLSLQALFIRNLMPWPFDKLISWLMASSLAPIHKTTSQVLDSITSNTKLKGVLCYLWGDYGEVPSRSCWATQRYAPALSTEYCVCVCLCACVRTQVHVINDQTSVKVPSF